MIDVRKQITDSIARVSREFTLPAAIERDVRASVNDVVAGIRITKSRWVELRGEFSPDRVDQAIRVLFNEIAYDTPNIVVSCLRSHRHDAEFRVRDKRTGVAFEFIRENDHMFIGSTWGAA